MLFVFIFCFRHRGLVGVLNISLLKKIVKVRVIVEYPKKNALIAATRRKSSLQAFEVLSEVFRV
jgi:hypothetical protein